MSRPSVVVYLS